MTNEELDSFLKQRYPSAFKKYQNNIKKKRTLRSAK